MLLTIDIGNSNIVYAVFDENQTIVFSKREETIKENPLEYYLEQLKILGNDIDFGLLDAAICSCVVPKIRNAYIDSFKRLFTIPFIELKADDFPQYTIDITNRSEIGTDLLATAIGAINEYNLPCIIADAGSATKITVVNQLKQFMGGVILPGLGMSAKAMKDFIPHLPEVSLELPDHILTSNTVEAIQAGLCYGIASSIEGVASRIEIELDIKAIKILTGGYGVILNPAVKGFIFDPNLLSKGLYFAYMIQYRSQILKH